MTRILITGSSRGIGAAAMAMLRQRDAQIIGHASSLTDEQTIAADFSSPATPQALWDAALDRLGGGIDVLINNAGLFEANSIHASDIEWLDSWEANMQINLTAAAQLSRFAVKHWLNEGAKGRIVHVASRAAQRGDSPEHWHYAAAKGGMLAMHKTIARAYADQGITSFAIAPGLVDTSMAEDYLASRGGSELLRDIPLGRVAEPEEIAKIICFCALDAPESMSGATIDANGASYVR